MPRMSIRYAGLHFVLGTVCLNPAGVSAQPVRPFSNSIEGSHSFRTQQRVRHDVSVPPLELWTAARLRKGENVYSNLIPQDFL